ncbi:DoxX family protein [Hyphomicrobium sp. CS1GBMeth3]|uniref:DoxX family protein n=1 Tax=Hyphomicrobium sp. CS1GBMeth3 TaxID=1892845 RepID=UPI000931B43F|nr:DoxX family protein [Hyphomicrobium sp. CS1GBMeth3]
MTRFFSALIGAMERIPHDLLALLARFSVGTVFFRSGLLKVEGWTDGTTIALFKDEYKLPVIPPEIAAYMATAAELALPPLLFLGIFTRFAGLALLLMTLVIQIFVYPNAFDTHGVWAVSLLYLMKYGAGIASIDHWLESRLRDTAVGGAPASK